MVSAKQLYELQQLQEALRQKRQALKDVEARLADGQALGQARRDLETKRQRLESLRTALKDQELSLQSLAEKIRNVERRLYGGSTTNPKELVNLQQELEQFRRSHRTEENHLLEMMIQVEEAQGQAHEFDERFTKARQEWEAQTQRLSKQRDLLIQELAELGGQEQEASGLLEAGALDHYRILQSSRGTAVAKVESGICRGCGLALPSHLLQRARTAKELVRCSSCGRILYVS